MRVMGDARRNQASGIGQVNAALNDLDRVTQENARQAEESAEAAQGMGSNAAVLGRMLEVFRMQCTHLVTKKPKVFPLGFFVGYSPSRVLVRPPLDLR
jgi:hypothetical protein